MKLVNKILDVIVETYDFMYLLLFMGLGCLASLVRNFIVAYIYMVVLRYITLGLIARPVKLVRCKDTDLYEILL